MNNGKLGHEKHHLMYTITKAFEKIPKTVWNCNSKSSLKKRKFRFRPNEFEHGNDIRISYQNSIFWGPII